MLLQAVARLWYLQMLQAAPLTPNPRDGPVVRVGEGPADRVLLFGNGPLHGWGVARRELSVPGHLAHMLHRRSGRPVTVEYVGDERMNAASSVSWLGTSAARGHDVVVIAMGMNDALRLSRLPRWRVDSTRLLEQVLSDSSQHAPVLLVGLPHIRRYAMADSWLGSVAHRRAEMMTATLMDLASRHDRVTFVAAPVEQFESGRPLGSSAMYRQWAEELADLVLPCLDAARHERAAVNEEPPRWEWAPTPTLLNRSDAGGVSTGLEAVVREVQEHFGVALAAVNLVDGERTHFIAGGMGAPTSIPRDLAYCGTTVTDDSPLVVLDAKKDARFRDNPFLDLVHLPFYAGVPLHALDGRAVATLCVLDTNARSAFDLQEFQRYATAAQQELQALEAAVSTYRPGGHPEPAAG